MDAYFLDHKHKLHILQFLSISALKTCNMFRCVRALCKLVWKINKGKEGEHNCAD